MVTRNQIFCVMDGTAFGFRSGISRADPMRHLQKIGLIREALGHDSVNLYRRDMGTFVIECDDTTCYGSGAYAGGGWYYALSRRLVGFDVIDLNDVPESCSDLEPLIDAMLLINSPNAGSPPSVLQICAAEAVGKLLGTGLDRDILHTTFPVSRNGTWKLRNQSVVRGQRIVLRDVSLLLPQQGLTRRLVAVVATLAPG